MVWESWVSHYPIRCNEQNSEYIFLNNSYNFNTKEFNRKNIDQIINYKISNLPVLNDDTNNIINFNDGYSNEIKNDKPRNFWDLLKSK